MKRTATTIVALLVALIGGLVGCTAGPEMGPGAQANARVLNDSEDFGLLYLREEEKLARDVYLTLGQRWGHQTFENIASSEQRHMDAIAGLLDRYGLPDPVGDNPRGVFTDPALQQLHDRLVERGMVSLTEALAVGGLIEETDIADLGSSLSLNPPADIAQVYENLQRGSRNHLRAFDGALDGQGIDYAPTVLSQRDFDDIVGSATERGGDASGQMQGGQGGQQGRSGRGGGGR